jgi:hypothetical protein
MHGVGLARAHGGFNIATGLWPLLHRRSFEKVFGPKVDGWLVSTVSGLLVVNGVVQARTRPTPEAVAQARRLGMGTALVLAAIDLRHAPSGRISRTYLLDAAAESGWIVAWVASLRRR